MRDIIIIPTFKRPEYLALCLEKILAAKGARDLDIRVYHDMRFGTAPPLESKDLAIFAGARFIRRDLHGHLGNMFNFLEAYKEAYADTEARYVYLIEDDVLVEPDFFDWHEAIQARGQTRRMYVAPSSTEPEGDFNERRDYFCSVGWHCIRTQEKRDTVLPFAEDPHAYIESAVDFSSIGVCWKRENLAAVVRHANTNYYRSPITYLAAAFQGSEIPPNKWTEQAGLIMRLVLEGKGSRVVAWAGAPRCAHIGIRGYHRPSGHNFAGELYHRIEGLRRAISEGSLNSLSKDPFDDINLPRRTAFTWEAEKLYVCQRW